MSDGATYDPSIIKDFAARLYKTARNITAVSAIGGLLVGAWLGSSLGSAIGDGGAAPTAAVGALVGLFVGLYIGQRQAFSLKLQAQVALCQAQIEENTRRR